MTTVLAAFKLVAFLVLLVGISNAATIATLADSRLIGGTDAYLSQIPYQVSVRRSGFHVCGGTIISKNYVLTAGKCVVKSVLAGIVTYPSADFTVRAGSVVLLHSGMLVYVADIIIHPKFANMLHDIALLRLKDALIYSANIKPINIATVNNIPLNIAVTISGWGNTKAVAGETPKTLQWTNALSVIDTDECQPWLYGDEAAESLLCLQHAFGYGICTGDIGSPAVYMDVLVGVASFTMKHCGSELPDGFVKVSYYASWIKANSDVK